jgi:dimethylargininase
MNTSFFTHSLVRSVSRSLGNCELVHQPRRPFDLELAIQQHAGYVAVLEAAGVHVTVLPEEPDFPDATFVEDAVLILDELAVICRLGTASREFEGEQMARVVVRFRPVQGIAAPGTLEGGDILRVGRTLFVGRSTRTNEDGIRQLEEIVRPFGYRVTPVKVNGCLHLKTGVTCPADGLLIINRGVPTLSM